MKCKLCGSKMVLVRKIGKNMLKEVDGEVKMVFELDKKVYACRCNPSVFRYKEMK
jgi:hypothetical protein